VRSEEAGGEECWKRIFKRLFFEADPAAILNSGSWLLHPAKKLYP
jgi:hypothetical protein